MGMTMTEKILARGAGRESVRPGDLVLAKVDFAMGHDLTIPPAGKIMREQMGAEKIWDPDRVAVTGPLPAGTGRRERDAGTRDARELASDGRVVVLRGGPGRHLRHGP